MALATIHRPLSRMAFGLVMLGSLALGCDSPGTSMPSGTAGGGLVGHPLVGSWTVDVTRADVAEAGFTDPGAQNENAGRFTWTFAPDGTWTSVQESLDGAPVVNPVFRGTFVVDGTKLTATTTFPPEYVDAGLHYTWSIDGDELRLDVLDPPDPIVPVIVETHPWQRAG